MSANNTAKTIEAYLDGELNEAENQAFQERLDREPELATAVATSREINAALRDEAALDFQQLVRERGTAYLAEQARSGGAKVTPLFSRKRWWAVAASAAAIALTIFLVQSGRNSTNQSGPDLFAAYHTTFEVNDQLRRGDNANLGLAEYRAGNYAAAAELFAAQIDEAGASSDYYLYLALGSAYLNQSPRQLNAAAESFEKIIDHGRTNYVPKAQWYLALVMLERDDLSAARTLIETVAKSSDPEVAKLAQQFLAENP